MVTISKFHVQNPRYVNLLKRKSSIPEEVEQTVKEVLRQVKEKGDEALYSYMKKFDHVDINKIGLTVTEDEFAYAREHVSNDFKEAVKKACDNLFRFHQKQLPADFSVDYEDGAILARKYTPIQSVAVTIPGNMAPLVSTLCMNLVPAIAGPGNNYTKMAKKLLFGEVKIDFLAGPSEIAILADENANPTFIAADLMSQAEHGTGFEASTAFCLFETQANEIKNEIIRLCEEHDLTLATRSAFENYGDIFIVDSIEDAIQAVNEIAPEHVELFLDDCEAVLPKITNAGAIFVGEYSTEPVGDYFCGTNHILPTCGTAKFSSGMSVQEFMRGYSVIRYPESALKNNSGEIIQLAESEGMRAHALAVKVRT